MSSTQGKMNGGLVYPNRILAEKEIARHQEILRKRIKDPSIKRIDNGPPKEYQHLKTNRKGMQMKVERDDKIRKENQTILSRVGAIQSRKEEGSTLAPGTRVDKAGRPKIDCHLSPRGASHTRGEAVPQPSLNYERRKREAERIAEGNAKILGHINKTKGFVNRKELEKDHIRSRDYLSLLSQRHLGEPGSIPSNSKTSPREPAFGKKHFITSRSTLNAGSSVLSSARSRTSRSKPKESDTNKNEKDTARGTNVGSASAQHDLSQDLGEDKSSIWNDSEAGTAPKNKQDSGEASNTDNAADNEQENTKGNAQDFQGDKADDRTEELFESQTADNDATPSGSSKAKQGDNTEANQDQNALSPATGDGSFDNERTNESSRKLQKDDSMRYSSVGSDDGADENKASVQYGENEGITATTQEQFQGSGKQSQIEVPRLPLDSVHDGSEAEIQKPETNTNPGNDSSTLGRDEAPSETA
eukprot:gb/GECG01015883.1/.p1 GENE.gb/GECG01015883.1/~~gb/GECG01015883.1/.p1  ORF type:complete len:473 (+),score=88.97 gb/GECG01015883.1/:1-1419(+)